MRDEAHVCCARHAEMAFSLVPLVGAALRIRTFAKPIAIDPGFEPEGVVSQTA
jgi:hypothetical protein